MAVKRWKDIKNSDVPDEFKIQQIEAKVYKKYPNAIKDIESIYGSIIFYIPNIGDIENVSIFFEKKRSITVGGLTYFDVIIANFFSIEPIDGMLVKYKGKPIMVYATHPLEIFNYYSDLEDQNADNFKYNIDLAVFKIIKDFELPENVKNKLTDGVKGLMLFS